MNRSAQSRHRPSSTRLPSTRIRRQSGDRAPWATMSCRATDFPPPGSPPISMFRSARVTWTRRPSSSVPRWTGSQIDSDATGIVSVLIAGHLLIVAGLVADHQAGDLPGDRVTGRGGDGEEDGDGVAAVRADRAAARE